MNLVIDASVACKWYLDEPLADAARRLAESDDMFLAPDLILAEVGNVLWQRLRKGEITDLQAKQITSQLPGVFFALVPTATLLERALQIAVEVDHPVYDGLYLALAERWDAPLVTADTWLFRKAQGTAWRNRVLHLEGYAPSD